MGVKEEKNKTSAALSRRGERTLFAAGPGEKRGKRAPIALRLKSVSSSRRINPGRTIKEKCQSGDWHLVEVIILTKTHGSYQRE